jgi:hypothetical protein
MAITITLLTVILAHFMATTLRFRVGLLVMIFLYSLYPKFFSLGVSDEAFALSGQRAMLYLLLGFYVLHALWGSTDVRRGIELAMRYRWVVFGTAVLLIARLGGNLATGRFDLGSFAAMVNEAVISLLIIILVITCIKTKNDILTALTLVSVSLLVNQFVAIYEFSSGRSLFPASIDIQYAIDKTGKLTVGSIREGFFRARGFFDNPLKLAGFLCLTIPGSVALVRTSPIFAVRLMAAATIVLALPTAIFTGSRTAITVILMIFGWYAYAYVAQRFGRYSRVIIRIGVIVLAVTAIITIAAGVADSILSGSQLDRSAESRALQFVRVPLALQASPLFGFGYARNIIDLVDAGHVDSYFLQTALEGGLFTLAILLIVFHVSLKLLVAVRRHSDDRNFAIIARHLSVSIGFAFLLSLVLSLSDIRFYLFLYIGLSLVLHHSALSKEHDFGLPCPTVAEGVSTAR